MRLTLILLALTTTAPAQWTIQQSHSTASLRGIHSLGKGIAWASGTQGTVLQTTDDGATWQTCTTPPEAGKLDFRGIQAFDANTAIVMSIGKGDQSRLYKTTDACKSWKLLFTNPDKEGFWDALKFTDRNTGYLLGDPVAGRLVLMQTIDAGLHWTASTSKDLAADNLGAFAASNSSLILPNAPLFGTGGGYIYAGDATCTMENSRRDPLSCLRDSMHFERIATPLNLSTPSAGIFSLANAATLIVAVGGDYTKPSETTASAAWSPNLGQTWTAAQTPPHGFRSAVAYDAPTKTWITVGPNGTDISTDDGKNWQPLKPSPTDAPDADQNWNALSLPFVVGPKGRIGKLNPTALKP